MVHDIKFINDFQILVQVIMHPFLGMVSGELPGVMVAWRREMFGSGSRNEIADFPLHPE